jgi:hypothetical protein
MVEAVVVIAMLTLGLMGLMFFRSFYLRTMQASRLARSGLLAYSMTGCDPEEPKNWLGQKDLDGLAAGNPNSNSEPATGKDQTQSASSSDKNASGFLGGLNALSGDGRGVLNPIATVDVSGKVELTTKASITSARKPVFTKTAKSKSYLTCGDKIREGSVNELADMLLGDLKKLL